MIAKYLHKDKTLKKKSKAGMNRLGQRQKIEEDGSSHGWDEWILALQHSAAPGPK
jgi:hypothetical protein